MHVEKLSTEIDAPSFLKALGVDGGGVNILASKMRHHLFSIRNMPVGAANILKQDALSVGADLAVPKGTVTAAQPYVDALLIVNHRQLLALSKKELAQPFGLRALAHELKRFALSHKPMSAQVMGIINANDDSFYAKSRFHDTDAINAIVKMIDEGAAIIDIGAVSSRPGSRPVSVDEEFSRIKPIIDALYANKLYEYAEFSVDSYTPEVVSYALERGFQMLNDITGLANDALCRLSADYGARVVVMHMQGTPMTMQKTPAYDHVLSDVANFFEQQLQKAERFGIKEVILDVGVGFGKTLEHNLQLVVHLEHFLKFNRPLLVGASRKSLIETIDGSAVQARLGGTLALHLKAVEHGAQIVRVHDVHAHVQALKIAQAVQFVN